MMTRSMNNEEFQTWIWKLAKPNSLIMYGQSVLQTLILHNSHLPLLKTCSQNIQNPFFFSERLFGLGSSIGFEKVLQSAYND